MDPLVTTAAAGLRARLEALDLLANNLANSSTPGFKADREAYSLYLGDESAEARDSGSGLAQVTAPTIDRHHTDLRQGQLLPSGSQSELALSGAGFFLVTGPQGPLITRAGRIQVARDGRLVTPEGYEFVTVEPRRIKADPQRPLDIDKEGTVSQGGVRLGKLKIINPDLSVQPPKREGVYFSLDSRLMTAPEASADVYQGRVEAANVSVPETAVRLINVLRQFESLNKAIQLGGEMSRKAVEEVARINP